MTDLRVLTWNVHGSARPPLAAIAEVLDAHQPDVVALQEARKGQATRLAGLLAWPRPIWACKHNAYWPLWWLAEGLAVLTPHRVAPHPPVVLTGGSRRDHRRRIVLPVEVEAGTDAGRVLIADVHLSSGDLRTARAAEAAALGVLLPDTIPTVVAGDLNDVPDSSPLAILQSHGFDDAWAECGTGDGATYPANAPVTRIDYLLVRGAEQVSAEVIADLGPAMSGLSDHRPVLAVLRVP